MSLSCPSSCASLLVYACNSLVRAKPGLGEVPPKSSSATRLVGSTPSTSRQNSCAAEVRSRLGSRSEEHTSELQSRLHLVCRLLLEKKKKKQAHNQHQTKYTDS